MHWQRWGQPLALVAAVFVGLAGAATVREDILTPGGALVVQQMDEGPLGTDFAVTLGRRVVMRSKEGGRESVYADFPVPKILKYVGQPVPPFDAVAVFQQYSWGNACNGGPIWCLGISRDGTFSASEAIDFCGGPAPLVSVTSAGVHIVLPASTARDGATTLPAEEWVFSGAKLRRVR